MEVAGGLGEAPDPRLGLVAAADTALGERLEKKLGPGAAVLAAPGGDDVDTVVERLGVAERGDLAHRFEAELVVAVSLNAGEEEAAAELLCLVVLDHRLGATPLVRSDLRAGKRGPRVLLGVVQVLDGDAPELTLEDGDAALGVGRDRDDSPLDAHSAPAPAADGADDDGAASIDVAVQQGVKRHDCLVRGRRGMDEVDHEPRLLARAPSW